MDVILRRGDITTRAAGAVALGILEGTRKPSGAAAALDRATRGAISALLGTRDFTGRYLQETVLYPARTRTPRLILVGLGRARDLTEWRAREAAAVAASRARSLGAGVLATVAHGAGKGGLDPARAAQVCAEGSILGHYRYAGHRSPEKPPLRRIEIIEHDAQLARVMKVAVERGARWAEGACFARDLVSTPGQELTPADLAARARQLGRETGARVQVLGVKELERLGLGALLAVGRGSAHPPRLIVLERGAATARARGRRERPVVIVGKGVTFDSGGISLKPGPGMEKMKYDMAGAAAVLGTFHALASVELPFPVVGIIPSAENMPGARALKPGDIVTAMDGTSIEVNNTDAEGRLILADAIAYAKNRFEPQAVVDLATLTGAVSIALGRLAAGLFSNDDGLAAELESAAVASGDRLWRLPVWDEYAENLKTDVADIVNVGGREGGAILGAMFIKHFAKGLRWAHLDIASVAWTSSDRPTARRGATGFGVCLLLEWLTRRAQSA